MYLSKAVLLLASVALALAQDAVQSKGIFLGKDTSDEKATGKAIFSEVKNHPTAAASIITALAKTMNFKPHEDGPVKSGQEFTSFSRKWESLLAFQVVEKPFCLLVLPEKSSREDLLRALHYADLRDPENQDVLAETLAGLVPETSHIKKSRQEWVMLLTAIKKKAKKEEPQKPPSSGEGDSSSLFFGDLEAHHDPEDVVTVDFYVLRLKLKVHGGGKAGGKVEIEEQEAVLQLVRLVSNTELLIELAEEFAKEVKKATVSDFEKFFTTPPQKKRLSWLDNEWFQAFGTAYNQYYKMIYSSWL
ncbi:hypothetical protein DFQ27_005358 [Actinomortierella ambigua]|uniref:Uncharacterized protein n=1 Tax=Actinomortierella ambigua TaxID=1343610 RepID=A0A9P6QHF8_9FUNG|nr:hypothetical protein DFQ27_005358 [Actinomortierella ambigua]